ncbi:hypothetical protein S140_224 [Shewanella sp. phage 1/40]|uniref:hypothetical protein n=1 Tax=Shewanella sp. phage 1/40 TaxID=1458860 RepID=UPI0004F84D0A|nr:hypothetical protein S140_224 [Shewanella sp. phage 1/40]AHK11631.1 hypothetical protein S140_224 [Shewanella sp. phage 1/40]
MSKLITINTERAGKGLIISGDIECNVNVCRLAGRTSYTVLIEGIDKGVSRATPLAMWQWLMDYFNVTTIEAPEVVEKVKRKNKVK